MCSAIENLHDPKSPTCLLVGWLRPEPNPPDAVPEQLERGPRHTLTEKPSSFHAVTSGGECSPVPFNESRSENLARNRAKAVKISVYY